MEDVHDNNDNAKAKERKVLDRRSLLDRACDRIQVWLRPPVEPGWRRIEWTNSVGEPTYMDFEGVPGEVSKDKTNNFDSIYAMSQPDGPSCSTSSFATITPGSYRRAMRAGDGGPKQASATDSELPSEDERGFSLIGSASLTILAIAWSALYWELLMLSGTKIGTVELTTGVLGLLIALFMIMNR